MVKFIRTTILTLIIVANLFCVAFAQEVIVEGFGTDRETALKDARRNAVEQVVGTFVDSRTITNDYMVEMDKIYLKSSGFVGKVEVLSEGFNNGMYKVRAKINVDKSPNSELLKQVQAVMALNDPKIAVAVLKENSSTHEDLIESAIIDRLVNLNFSHVTNAAISNSSLNNIQNVNADFIVLAKTRASSSDLVIPDFKGGSIETGLNNGRVEMTVKIIRVDSNDILETFSVESSGFGEGSTAAERDALKNMANQAADKVDEKFRRIGAREN